MARVPAHLSAIHSTSNMGSQTFPCSYSPNAVFDLKSSDKHRNLITFPASHSQINIYSIKPAIASWPILAYRSSVVMISGSGK